MKGDSLARILSLAALDKSDIEALSARVDELARIGFRVVQVEELPETGADDHTLYLVPNESGDGYDEYLWIDNAWESVGSTEVDLSDYYTKTEAETNFLKKDNATSFTPTGNYNPATKKYVDDNKGQTIQYSTMPTANADNLGKIVQYIGTTDSTYTNGYFYECVVDNNVYSWENIQVQSGGSDTTMYVLDLTEIKNNYQLTNSEKANLLAILKDMEAKQKIRPILLNSPFNGYTATHGQYLLFSPVNWLNGIIGRQTYSFDYVNDQFSNDGGGNNYSAHIKIYIGVNIVNDEIDSISDIIFRRNDYLILKKDNTIAYTPTADSYNPATAKYAEKMIESVAPAYNSSSTYDEGDYVSYQGKLYICNTAITVAENWTAAHWTETNVVSEMSSGGSVSIDDSSITENSDHEIQTVGVIDSNSGNTNKIWTGTLEQYDLIVNKDADTYYCITDDEGPDLNRPHVEVITSSTSTYTIDNLTANKSYKLGELTSLTITACATFDEESVIYFDSGSTATTVSLPSDVIIIGDEIEENKSYIISVLNKIAVIKGYEVE